MVRAEETRDHDLTGQDPMRMLINGVWTGSERTTSVLDPFDGEIIAFDQQKGSENRRGYFYRVPIGVVAAITPFNDP